MERKGSNRTDWFKFFLPFQSLKVSILLGLKKK